MTHQCNRGGEGGAQQPRDQTPSSVLHIAVGHAKMKRAKATDKQTEKKRNGPASVLTGGVSHVRAMSVVRT